MGSREPTAAELCGSPGSAVPRYLKALPERKTEQPTLEQAQQVQAQGGGGAPLSESPTGAGQGPGEKGPGSGGTVVRKRAAWPLLPGGPWEPKAHGQLESRLPWDRQLSLLPPTLFQSRGRLEGWGGEKGGGKEDQGQREGSRRKKKGRRDGGRQRQPKQDSSAFPISRHEFH